MRKSKTQKGITLVALIITIIILLILAVVAIRSITGDGILQKAREAADATERGQIQEELDLAASNLKMESVIRKNMSYEEQTEWLREELYKQDESATVSANGNGFTGNYKDHNFSISEDYKVTIGDYAQNDNNNSNENNDDNSSDEIIEPEENTDNSQQEDDGIFQENRTINGQPYSSRNPIIPAGFKPVDTETSSWGDGTSAPDVDNGLVISDGNSEFVWVPVTTTIAAYGLDTVYDREPDVVTGVSSSSTVNSASGTSYDAIASNLTKAGCTQDLNGDNTVNAYDFKIQLENEFEAMATSVNKYGGFYVGRYETSINNGTAQSVKNATSATASSSSANTWYGLYKIQKTYNTSSVKSSMIWGSQYDAMMTWMGSAANTTINEKNTTRKTGSVETDKIKNVYDLYGNSFEWTLAAFLEDSRYARGGRPSYPDAPSWGRYSRPTQTHNSYGSRLALYIV